MIGTWHWPRAVRALRMALDLAVLAAAHYLAYLLRFEGTLPRKELHAFAVSLPVVVAVTYLSLLSCGVSGWSWRYVSLPEVRRIGLALLCAATLLLLLVWSLDQGEPSPQVSAAVPPRGVLVLDAVLGLVGLTGSRVAVRLWYERSHRKRRKGLVVRAPTLLIGAGSAGAEALKQIAEVPHLGIDPVGFLDDDPQKSQLVIHGVAVLGTVADVGSIARAHGVKQALITIGNPAGEHLRRMVNLCRKYGVSTKVIPGIRDILEQRVNLAAIRELDIEDLLQREPIHLDLDSIAAFLNGRRILVSGAGGSIGSELCRTICRFGPAALILVDNTENNLFHIHRELTNEGGGAEVIPCLADICDRTRMERIFAHCRPEVVLHAAAYKHVPMIEWNPGAAIKNNVLGTRTIADLADQYGVGEFVMISTDKAVNPTSIMGASKRIAEMYIQALSQRSSTRLLAVRLGNVLGSAGSVIPTFKEQIARGGPITITHPEMQRYFMTIPEACQLIMQAAAMGQGGEIFILDMGKPVKILDLARSLISLSGLSPKDIEIRFTGMRPGEKLFEELALQEEVAGKTQHPKIFIGHLRPANWEDMNDQLEQLYELADCGEPALILRKLKEIVPEFQGGQLDSRRSERFRLEPEHETVVIGTVKVLGMPGVTKPVAAAET